ncbi:tyrosine-type recombinase/integrase, partial [Bifidobacterium sp. UBA744]|uniref:tyrosine-type recombinase/integrase n=1 Tax=Bifidobacterium sp. UBA744 TaxID=1946112 RepID=UPI0039C891EA
MKDDGLEGLLARFEAHIDVERGLSAATVNAYASDLKRYISWLRSKGITGLGAVTRRDVEDYVAFLDGEGESARSKARRLASVHEFHKFAAFDGAVDADVAAAVKAPKAASTLPDVLTIDEVARLLDAVSVGGSTDPVALRDKALLEFMYATGARVSEAVGVNLDDVDVDERMARLMGKGGKQRLVPLGSYACRALQAYVNAGRPSLERRCG